MSFDVWGERMRVRTFAVVVAVVGSVVGGGTTAAAAPVCAPPEVSVADAAQYEGSGNGTKAFAVTVTMADPGPGCSASGSVHYRTADGSAVAGQDYVATTSSLTWDAPGPRVVAVQVERDDAHELDEAFVVELFGPRGVTIDDDTATATVLNDDAGVLGGGVVVAIPAGGICWWPADHCPIPVQVSTTARAPISVVVRTVDGTAVAGKDYVAIKKQVVTIPTGASRVEVPVEVMAGAEPGEYFGVEISDPTAGTIGVGRGRVTFREG
jgi:Calx-beta domain-containing protein